MHSPCISQSPQNNILEEIAAKTRQRIAYMRDILSSRQKEDDPPFLAGIVLIYLSAGHRVFALTLVESLIFAGRGRNDDLPFQVVREV